jgi:hypothetical protein
MAAYIVSFWGDGSKASPQFLSRLTHKQNTIRMFAMHFQTTETTKCPATLARGIAGAGKIVATKF